MSSKIRKWLSRTGTLDPSPRGRKRHLLPRARVSFPSASWTNPTSRAKDFSLKCDHLQFPQNKAILLLLLLLFVLALGGRTKKKIHYKALQRRQNVSHEKPKVKTVSTLSKRILQESPKINQLSDSSDQTLIGIGDEK